MTEVLIENLNVNTRLFIDQFAEELFSDTSSSEKVLYPHIKTSKGLARLSLMTAEEWSGLLLACIIVLKTTCLGTLYGEGRTIPCTTNHITG